MIISVNQPGNQANQTCKQLITSNRNDQEIEGDPLQDDRVK